MWNELELDSDGPHFTTIKLCYLICSDNENSYEYLITNLQADDKPCSTSFASRKFRFRIMKP